MFRSIFLSYRHHTITRDLVLRLAFVLAVLLIILGLFNYTTTLQHQQNLLEEQANEAINSLAEIVTVPMWNLDLTTINAIGRAFEQTGHVDSVHIEDNLGRVLYESSSAITPSGFVEEKTIFFEGREIGLVRIQISTQAVDAIRQNILVLTAGSVLITITAVIFFTAYLLKRYHSDPISQLQVGINRLASGEYQYRFPSAPQVELNDIIHHVNKMAAQIEERDRYLEHQVNIRTAELAERVEQLALLNQVGRKSNSILDFDELLTYLVQTIQKNFDLYVVAIFLINQEDREQIQLKAMASPIDVPADKPHTIKITTKSKGVLARVVNTGELCLLNDVVKAGDDFLAVDFLPDTKAELALPLRIGPKIIGVLDLQCVTTNRFDSVNLQVLQTLAEQVAVTVRNAQLYQIELKRRQRAESLEQAGRQLSSSLDLSQLPQRILQELFSVIPYQYASLVHYTDGQFQLLATQGYPDSYTPQISDKEQEIYHQMMADSQRVLIDDLLDELQWIWPAQLETCRSWLAIPLLSKNELLGILSLANLKPHAFTHNDQLFISTFASQAAIALENAGLYDQISRFNEQLEQLVAERTQQLSVAYQNLERIDQSKTDFIEIMAHELRTPLSIIIGYAQILETMIDHQKAISLIGGIEAGAQRLSTLINGMLDVFRLENNSLKAYCATIDILPLFDSLKRALEEDLEARSITLEVESLDTLPSIWADPDLLKKLFHNLLINGIKYTPDGGKITVNGRYQPHTSPPTIQIQITDSGIGIDAHEHPLIFEKFYQTGRVALHSSGKTKFKGGGPGLGLAIAKGIVDLHEGRIWVESSGHDEETMPGSTFFIELPLRAPTEEA